VLCVLFLFSLSPTPPRLLHSKMLLNICDQVRLSTAWLQAIRLHPCLQLRDPHFLELSRPHTTVTQPPTVTRPSPPIPTGPTSAVAKTRRPHAPDQHEPVLPHHLRLHRRHHHGCAWQELASLLRRHLHGSASWLALVCVTPPWASSSRHCRRQLPQTSHGMPRFRPGEVTQHTWSSVGELGPARQSLCRTFQRTSKVAIPSSSGTTRSSFSSQSADSSPRARACTAA